MAKLKPIAKTVHIGKVNMLRLADKVIDKVFDNTVYKGKDVKDRPFKKYSDHEPFFFRDKQGRIRRAQGYKQAKSAGGLKYQSGGPGKSAKPNLYLSGKTMRSLLTSGATEDTAEVGWKNTKSEQKLKWNESDRGKNRQIAKDTGDFPFAPSVEKWFYKSIDKILDKKVNKTSQTIIFKI